jgi:hypothetical protein
LTHFSTISCTFWRTPAACGCDHLGEYNAQLVKKNGQAITLYFKTWPNVDIVPAYRVMVTQNDKKTVSHYMIPDMERGTWIRTEPHHRASNMTKAFARAPALPRLIRMLKEWNRVHSAYMQSFHIEAIARKLEPNADDWSWWVLQGFERLATVAKQPLIYPKASGQQIDAYLSWDDRRELLNRLETAYDRAGFAWWSTYKGRSDHKTAIEEYQRIFGDRFPAYA